MTMQNSPQKKATLYRMVMPKHLCPYGLKSKDLLQRKGFEVEDHHLTTREQTDAFMEKEGVDTTPQTYINGKRIGGFDELAQRWVRYSKLYPFGEALAGVLMLAGSLLWLAAPVAIFIGTIGAVSVIKAVYVDRRELKCACVGGNSKVPLGAISLTENLMMLGMGLWMLIAYV